MTGPLFIIVSFVLVLYVGAPILIRTTFKLNARGRFEPVEVDGMPSEVYAYFGRTAPDLERCGFTLATYFRTPDMVPGVVGYVALWVNRSAGQMATGVVMYSTPGGQVRVKSYTEFLTKLGDGMCVLTNNSSDLSCFKPVPMKDSLYAAVVQDLEALYRLHLSRESRLLPPAAPRYLPEEGQELASFAEGCEYDMRRQAKVGYLREVQPGLFRQTWVGAYVMTWGELPPVKQIRRAFAQARVRRELQEATIRPVAPPRNVTISHVSPYLSPP